MQTSNPSSDILLMWIRPKGLSKAQTIQLWHPQQPAAAASVCKLLIWVSDRFQIWWFACKDHLCLDYNWETFVLHAILVTLLFICIILSKFRCSSRHFWHANHQIKSYCGVSGSTVVFLFPPISCCLSWLWTRMNYDKWWKPSLKCFVFNHKSFCLL